MCSHSKGISGTVLLTTPTTKQFTKRSNSTYNLKLAIPTSAQVPKSPSKQKSKSTSDQVTNMSSLNTLHPELSKRRSRSKSPRPQVSKSPNSQEPMNPIIQEPNGCSLNTMHPISKEGPQKGSGGNELLTTPVEVSKRRSRSKSARPQEPKSPNAQEPLRPSTQELNWSSLNTLHPIDNEGPQKDSSGNLLLTTPTTAELSKIRSRSKSARPQEPKSPNAQEPQSPSAQEPNGSSLNTLHPIGKEGLQKGSDDNALLTTLTSEESPRPQMPKCPSDQEPKSPSAQEPNGSCLNILHPIGKEGPQTSSNDNALITTLTSEESPGPQMPRKPSAQEPNRSSLNTLHPIGTEGPQKGSGENALLTTPTTAELSSPIAQEPKCPTVQAPKSKKAQKPKSKKASKNWGKLKSKLAPPTSAPVPKIPSTQESKSPRPQEPNMSNLHPSCNQGLLTTPSKRRSRSKSPRLEVPKSPNAQEPNTFSQGPQNGSSGNELLTTLTTAEVSNRRSRSKSARPQVPKSPIDQEPNKPSSQESNGSNLNTLLSLGNEVPQKGSSENALLSTLTTPKSSNGRSRSESARPQVPKSPSAQEPKGSNLNTLHPESKNLRPQMPKSPRHEMPKRPNPQRP
jgi:hypothetical protein